MEIVETTKIGSKIIQRINWEDGEFNTFTFSHLDDAFIQSDLQKKGLIKVQCEERPQS